MDSEHTFLGPPDRPAPDAQAPSGAPSSASSPLPSSSVIQHLYADLRKIAANYLRQESNAATLQPTALVHDVFVRMSRTGSPGWSNAQEFFERASRVMRQTLVDHARVKNARKRGGAGRSSSQTRGLFDEPASDHDPTRPTLDVLVLDEALTELETFDPHLARLVQLRFFLGLTIEQSAASLGVSTSKVDTDWRLARAWLANRLKPTE